MSRTRKRDACRSGISRAASSHRLAMAALRSSPRNSAQLIFANMPLDQNGAGLDPHNQRLRRGSLAKCNAQLQKVLTAADRGQLPRASAIHPG